MVVMFEDGGTWVVGHETFRDDREREILWREGREGRKGKKKWFNKQCTNGISV